MEPMEYVVKTPTVKLKNVLSLGAAEISPFLVENLINSKKKEEKKD